MRAKFVGAGLAAIGLRGAGVGIGNVFSALLLEQLETQVLRVNYLHTEFLDSLLQKERVNKAQTIKKYPYNSY